MNLRGREEDERIEKRASSAVRKRNVDDDSEAMPAPPTPVRSGDLSSLDGCTDEAVPSCLGEAHNILMERIA